MILFLLTLSAMAEPQFTNLDKGQKAPFAGKLLNDEAIAEIVAKKHLSEAMCRAMIDKSVEITKAKTTYSCEIAIAENEKLMRDLKAENDYLMKKHKNKKWTLPVVAAIGGGAGFVAGVGSVLYVLLSM